MPQNLILFLCLALLSLSACTHSRVSSPNAKDATRIPSHAFQSNDPNQETIAVIGLNDFHGNLLPKERKLPDGRVIESGGALALAGMVKILRAEMPGRVAIIDAGDEWQGTLESNLTQGQNVVEFYNRLGVNAAAIGNHEFDFGQKNMSAQFERAHYPYVAANIFIKGSTEKRPQWKHESPSTQFEVAGYHIGVVGFSTQLTPQTTRAVNVEDLDFIDPVKPVQIEAKQLRAHGADLILVTAHAGTVCEDQLGLKDWKFWQESTPMSKCDDEQEIVKLSNALNPGEVDGIISGHTHHTIHHFFNHLPVVQDEAFNQYFNIIYFTFDKKTRKLLPEFTRIEGLIPICMQTFAGTPSCDIRTLGKGESPVLVPATFHGQPVTADAEIAAWLKPLQESTLKYRQQILGHSELPLFHLRDQENPLANLVADVMLKYGKADFAFANAGGIRASIDAGPINYDHLYQALPFDNHLNVVKMSGKQVKLMYRLATSGTHGYPGIAGARLTVIPLTETAPMSDLDQNGKLERWETNHLLKVETAKGKPINDKKIYTVATYDFLVTGGDDMAFLMKQITKKNIRTDYPEDFRNLVIQYLHDHDPVNTVTSALYDPKNPRIILSPK